MSSRTCLPELLALTAALVALRRSRAGRALAGAWPSSGRITRPVAWIATALLTALAVAWPDGNTYDAYRTFLHGVPPGVQAAAGLALALVPGWIAAEAWLSRRRSKAAHALLAAACLAWTLIHALLPVHLSAPDFDDFFVIGKLAGAVEPGWFNDKPLFTIWDYPFRWMEAAAADDPLARFRINGWFALVYVVLVGLWLERLLPPLLGRRGPPGVAAWLPWIAAPHLGPVVLSHTVPYELACGAWILALGLALERMRAGPRPTHALLPVATLALARWLQAGGHNATAMAWMPVYVHGLLVLRQRRAPAGVLAWAGALSASAVIDVLLREQARLRDALAGFGGAATGVAVMGVLPLVAALAWLWRRAPATWTLRRFVALAWRRPSSGHVWLVGLLSGAAVYLLANQDNFGVPIPGPKRWGAAWDFATNHARYAVFFYPFLVVLLALLLVPRGRRGLAALALCAVAWSAAYVGAFYLGPAGLPAAQSGYRRNNRFMEATRALLPRLDGAPAAAYLPIPRDHGDHYLLRAVDPTRTAVSACSAWARGRPDLPLFVSGYTLGVLGKELDPERILPLDAAARRADVLVLRMRDLAPAGLDGWCALPAVARWTEEPPR